jgi:hypothetical protein
MSSQNSFLGKGGGEGELEGKKFHLENPITEIHVPVHLSVRPCYSLISIGLYAGFSIGENI